MTQVVKQVAIHSSWPTISTLVLLHSSYGIKPIDVINKYINKLRSKC